MLHLYLLIYNILNCYAEYSLIIYVKNLTTKYSISLHNFSWGLGITTGLLIV